jgi:hypothetical protein
LHVVQDRRLLLLLWWWCIRYGNKHAVIR